jgi:D-alanyl-D-alanine carboxypeptidase
MAGRLGITRTKFANANGLSDPDQITTARDTRGHLRSLFEHLVGA